jgi:hypothetical protein
VTAKEPAAATPATSSKYEKHHHLNNCCLSTELPFENQRSFEARVHLMILGYILAFTSMKST